MVTGQDLLFLLEMSKTDVEGQEEGELVKKTLGKHLEYLVETSAIVKQLLERQK